MKDRYLADRAISAIEQLQVDPELVAVGTDVIYDVRGEVIVTVRFEHAPKKEEKKRSTHDIPVDPELVKIGKEAVEAGFLDKPPLVELKEEDFATGGIIEKPGRILFGNYTPENDRETVGELYFNILDHLKTGIPEEVVIILDGKLIAEHVVRASRRSAETTKAGKVAGFEKSVTGDEDGTAVGERAESSKLRAGHFVDEGSDC